MAISWPFLNENRFRLNLHLATLLSDYSLRVAERLRRLTEQVVLDRGQDLRQREPYGIPVLWRREGGLQCLLGGGGGGAVGVEATEMPDGEQGLQEGGQGAAHLLHDCKGGESIFRVARRGIDEEEGLQPRSSCIL